jgi:hypothetical protein
MTLMEELEKRLYEKTTRCTGLPMRLAIPKARTIVTIEVERFLKEKGLWKRGKAFPPASYFRVCDDFKGEDSVIVIHFEPSLKKLLHERSKEGDKN